jgi:DNA replication protein DnaC
LTCIDDFAIKALDATQTNDFYEIVIEHRGKTTIIRSSHEPVEWLAMTSDTLLAQSAIDRLTQGAHTLVIEGSSWRQCGTLNRSAAIDENKETSNAN